MIIPTHELAHEFPEFHDAIHALKISNEHFAAQMARYNHLDREIRRHEEGIEPMADEFLVAQKRERLALKDELYALLRQAKSA